MVQDHKEEPPANTGGVSPELGGVSPEVGVSLEVGSAQRIGQALHCHLRVSHDDVTAIT